MNPSQDLYVELKADIAALAEPLFEFSAKCLRNRGNFLPHAAVLTAGGAIELVMGLPDSSDRPMSSVEVLPALHETLRTLAQKHPLSAIGVAENVSVTRGTEAPIEAIKVLFEHKRGLTIALYHPFRKQFLRGYAFGETFSVPAAGEVNAWPVA